MQVGSIQLNIIIIYLSILVNYYYNYSFSEFEKKISLAVNDNFLQVCNINFLQACKYFELIQQLDIWGLR